MIKEKKYKSDTNNQQIVRNCHRQLIPNYRNLDSNVQKQLSSILEQVITPLPVTIPDHQMIKRKKIQQLSKLSLLEEAPLLRSHFWKLCIVLLQTLELNPSTWTETRNKNSELYRTLKNKFLSSYVDEQDLLGIGGNDLDRQLWDQIALDTKRTHSSLNFFQTEITTTYFGKVYASRPTKHCDMLGRILYIWGKINPTVRYVQGMNEILAPLYYLEFQSLEDVCWDRESEVFFLFSSVMSFVIDMHIKEMDDCQSGIMGRMITLNHFLRVVDTQLWQKMEDQGIFPQYYSFRWLALLLAQQFSLYDTMKIWDLLFAYQGHKRYFLLYCFCLAILKVRRQEILQNDFITSLPLIQKLKDVNIEVVIKHGIKLYDDNKRKNIQKQYNKIMDECQSSKQKKLHQEKQREEKAQRWSYADLAKNTGNYFSKWNIWAKKQ